jgi:hypothetical protein
MRLERVTRGTLASTATRTTSALPSQHFFKLSASSRQDRFTVDEGA